MNLDGLTDEELLAIINAPETPRAAPTRGQAVENLPTSVPFSVFGRNYDIPLNEDVAAGLVGAGRTVNSQWEGAKQALYALTGDQSALDAQAKRQAQDAELYAKLSKEKPLATFVGEAAPYLVGGSPAAFAAMGANEYGTPAERLTRGAAGYVGGKAGEYAGRMFGPASRRAEDMPFGIPLTYGQQNPGTVGALVESVAGALPFGGGVNKARNEGLTAATRQLTSTTGEVADRVTPEFLGHRKALVGNRIGEIAERSQVRIGFPELSSAANLRDKVAESVADPNVRLLFDRQLQNFYNAIKVEPNRVYLPGKLYKDLMSDAGKIGKANPDLSPFMHEYRALLRDAMTRSLSGRDAGEWLQRNREYFNTKQLADALKNSPGTVRPASLLAQVNQAQQTSRYGGGNDLAARARYLRNVFGDGIPNSGTAQRSWVQNLITNPVGGIAAGGGLYGTGVGVNNMFGTDINPLLFASPLLGVKGAARWAAGKPLPKWLEKELPRVGGSATLGLLADM